MILRSRLFAAISLGLLIAAGLIGGPGSSLEQSIMAWSGEVRSSFPALPRTASVLTLLGGAPVTLGVTGAVAAWLLWCRQWFRALLLALTVLGTRLLVDVLKDWVGRPRPHLETLPASLAFPSGHSANSMATYLAVALIAFVPGIRRTAAWTAFGLSILIGLTRVAIGVHWPSDVIGGWAIGLLTVGAMVVLGERSGALSQETKHDVVCRHRFPSIEDKAP